MHQMASPGSGARLKSRGVGRTRPVRDPRIVLLLLFAFLFAASAQTSHVVKAGDSLWAIAKKYGTTPQAIAEANHIANPSLIIIGRSLVIPGQMGAPHQSAPAMKPVANTQQWNGKHVVQKGEHLTKIAARYGVSVPDLAGVNGLKNASMIRAGATLIVPGPRELTVEELLAHYGKEFGVDPALVKAVAWQESGWKQKVVSHAGAIGVMQVIPETAAFTGRQLLGGMPLDVNNLDQNVKAGVRFLAYLLTLTNGDEKLAVAGYFQGLRSVRTKGITPKTEKYVANVMALKKRFGG